MTIDIPWLNHRVRLGYVNGTVYPWGNYDLPKELQKPLYIKKHGSLCGMSSGNRSALLKIGDKTYKLKGCNYQNSDYEDEPWGAMSEKRAKNELKLTDELSKKYSEFGFNYPVKPAGRFEYEMLFRENPVNCALLETESKDIRMNRLLMQIIFNSEKLGSDKLRKLTESMTHWLGFDQHLLEQSKISIPEIGMDHDNVLLWKNGNGYGLSRIDFESSVNKLNEKWIARKIKHDMSMLNTHGFSCVTYSAAKDNGINPILAMQGYCSGMGIFIEYVDNRSEEKVVADGPWSKTLRISADRFKWVLDLENIYRTGLEGNVPEAIDTKLIDLAFA